MKRMITITGSVLMLSLVLNREIIAASSSRTVSSGNWTDGNWSAGTPTSSIDALIGSTDAANMASVDLTNTANASRVYVGNGSVSVSATGTWNILSGAQITTTFGELIAAGNANSVGIVTQTGGTNTVGVDMNVGLD